MRWQDIEGCFTFHEFYQWIAVKARNDSWHGVEVGALKGQSAAFLFEQLRGWMDTGPCKPRLDLVEREPSNVVELRRNLVAWSDMASIHCTSSVQASTFYSDDSLDFVMLDAGHEYADLRTDIDAWWPKLKPGGILATHDYCHYFPGLMRAWNESFKRFNVWPCSEWPDFTVHGQRDADARADIRNRSALHKETDFMSVAWVVK